MPSQPAFDYYEALEVEKTATTQEIISAYRRLALIHHPDRNLDNPEKATAAFQKVRSSFCPATSHRFPSSFANPSDHPRSKSPTRPFPTRDLEPSTTPDPHVDPHDQAAAPSTLTPIPTSTMTMRTMIFSKTSSLSSSRTAAVAEVRASFSPAVDMRSVLAAVGRIGKRSTGCVASKKKPRRLGESSS
jgi:hypothetical protein